MGMSENIIKEVIDNLFNQNVFWFLIISTAVYLIMAESKTRP
jgi:hypothetical protein